MNKRQLVILRIGFASWILIALHYVKVYYTGDFNPADKAEIAGRLFATYLIWFILITFAGCILVFFFKQNGKRSNQSTNKNKKLISNTEMNDDLKG